MRFEIGQLVDSRYLLQKKLEIGSTGELYACQDKILQINVSIKIFTKSFYGENISRELERLQREAKVLNTLKHPNIVHFIRLGLIEKEIPYIIMEEIRGKTLSKVLEEENSLDTVRTVKIALALAQALNYAHSQGIVHRNICPANIILYFEGQEERIKLIDFGLCQIDLSENYGNTKLTPSGVTFGTPYYMSPEQALAKELDSRTDIYSFGVVVFEMLTARLPIFLDKTVFNLAKLLNEPVPRISDLVPSLDFPKKLDSLLQKCLAKSANLRYQNFSEIIPILEELNSEKIYLKLNLLEFKNANSKGYCEKKKFRNCIVSILVLIIIISFSLLSILFQNESRDFLLAKSFEFVPAKNLIPAFKFFVEGFENLGCDEFATEVLKSGLNYSKINCWNLLEQQDFNFVCFELSKKINNTELICEYGVRVLASYSSLLISRMQAHQETESVSETDQSSLVAVYFLKNWPSKKYLAKIIEIFDTRFMLDGASASLHGNFQIKGNLDILQLITEVRNYYCSGSNKGDQRDTVLNSLGYICPCLRCRQADRCKLYIDKTLQLAELLADRDLLIQIHVSLGEYYLLKDQKTKAEKELAICKNEVLKLKSVKSRTGSILSHFMNNLNLEIKDKSVFGVPYAD